MIIRKLKSKVKQKDKYKKGYNEIDYNFITKYYNNPLNPGSFSGLNSLLKSLRTSKYPNIKLIDLIKWSSHQEAYTMHFPVIKKNKRNKTLVGGIDHTWQMDLCDMRALKNENENFQYILTIIDVFSKKAQAYPLKNKSGMIVYETLKKVFSKKCPKKIHTDEGKEFFNKHVKDLMKEKGIKLYYTNSENKASIVERFNRTLKEKLWRYFTHIGNMKYIIVIDKILKAYNNTYNRSIKMTPNNVSKSNSEKVYISLYDLKNDEEVYDGKLRKGDHVRLSKYKSVFEKGYKPNWTKEVFVIDKILFKTNVT